MKSLILSVVLALAMLLSFSAPMAKAPEQTWGSSAPLEPESLPRGLLPPGASVPDPGPSRTIFPPETLPIRFDHRKHMALPNVSCVSCHPGGKSSRVASDRLLPSPARCDQCHGSSHQDLLAVRAGAGAIGSCETCHEGYKPGRPVAKVQLTTPNLRFDHAAHANRNIGCPQCHGDVAKLAKATRDQLPRMAGCLGCHDGDGPKSLAHPASGVCTTCHLDEKTAGRLASRNAEGASTTVMATHFSTGTLLPDRSLKGAAHDPEFLRRHASVAASDSRLCGNCHKEEFCADCHDGRVRPRTIHPNDYLSMHAIEARQMAQKCQSCHREQSFCLSCHQRLGVSESGPLAGGSRFHPPKAVFSDLPRGPQHHAQEAARNLNACVSCHVERDCVVCHGGKGIGGGFNPHPAGFSASCDRAYGRNPRPCLTCHDLGSVELDRCR